MDRLPAADARERALQGEDRVLVRAGSPEGDGARARAVPRAGQEAAPPRVRGRQELVPALPWRLESDDVDFAVDRSVGGRVAGALRGLASDGRVERGLEGIRTYPTRTSSVRKRMSWYSKAEKHGDRSWPITPMTRGRDRQFSPRAVRSAGA